MYLAWLKIAGYTFYRQHWLLFISIHANTIPAGYSYIHACTNKTHSLANLQDLIPTLAGINISNYNTNWPMYGIS